MMRLGAGVDFLPDCSLALSIALKANLTGKLLGSGKRLWREGNLRA